MGMMGQDEMGEGLRASRPLGGPGGQVAYPAYLVDGRPPADPETLRARPGERLRLRVVNAAADTAFRVALGGATLDNEFNHVCQKFWRGLGVVAIENQARI